MLVPKDAQRIVHALQLGTRFSYSYVNGESRRLRSDVVFMGVPSAGSLREVAETLRCATIDDLFIPEQVGLLPLRSDMVTSGSEVWHKLEGVILSEVTGCTMNSVHIDSFVEKFVSAEWDERCSPALCHVMSSYDIDHANW